MRKTESPTARTGGNSGHLLEELERRQDDVIAQLDDLDSKLQEVLNGLEPASDDEADQPPPIDGTSSGDYFA
ncbi:MAG: hypothetical protein AAFU85_20895 [Planctomycetota bacterium]